MVDTALLTQAIANSGKKKAHLASRCGLSRQGLKNKIDGKSDFYAKEINVLCTELGINTPEERDKIFFAD